MRYTISAAALLIVTNVSFGQCANGRCQLPMRTVTKSSTSSWQLLTPAPQTVPAPKTVTIPKATVTVPMPMPGPTTVTRVQTTTVKKTVIVKEAPRLGFVDRLKARVQLWASR